MKRHHFLLSPVLFILLCAGLTQGKQPNITVDDIAVGGIGAYGGNSYKTPVVDKLTNPGIRFDHAFSQLMSGRYHHRNWLTFGLFDPCPGWDKDQFIRHVLVLNKVYKFSEDGRLFDMKKDLLGQKPIKKETKRTKKVSIRFKTILKRVTQNK
ncbi:hypothetical protein N9B94_03280 [Verrucomicrobia bacterium]|nr:hypothetical protein [Verrucomicrobiota bacterium]